MSRLARAESALIESLKKSQFKKKNEVKFDIPSGEEDFDPKLVEDYTSRNENDEATLVKKLEDVPKFNKKKEFPGLAKHKLVKKDNHMKALDGFASLLDSISEKLEQDVLIASRTMRESVDGVDMYLNEVYASLKDDSFLIVRSEGDLITILQKLKSVLENRSTTIENFVVALDHIEANRADLVTSELKKLVDQLVAIAHQLRDEIEHVVESETADLNSVLIVNRKAHAELASFLRRNHSETEVVTFQYWEDARVQWRWLRHHKAINDYKTEVHGPSYLNPGDRVSFMKSVQSGQLDRHSQRLSQLQLLGDFTADSITSEKVINIQAKFGTISEEEMEAVQACYNGLCNLSSSFRVKAEDRVEQLRKELHVYGALSHEPNLQVLLDSLSKALCDESLNGLWRQGGGLKNDFQTLVTELSSDNVAYEFQVVSIKEKIEIICSGFDLKDILLKRGRQAQLDKIRNLIIKMRNSSRNDSKNVVQSLLPELEEILDMENFPSIFRKIVSDCISEMNTEISRLGLLADTISVAPSLPGSTSMSMPGTTTGTMRGGTTSGGGGGGSRLSTTTNKSKSKQLQQQQADDKSRFIDPLSIKLWTRKLGVLYFSSDIPIEYQDTCLLIEKCMFTQRKCNDLVDATISEQCGQTLSRLDKNYKLLLESIATFLENQASFLNNCANHICEFFLNISLFEENHKKKQLELVEKSADELWDLSEDFRLEKEDREKNLEDECQKIRESIDQDELQSHFESVLLLLAGIQNSYREYHSKACFAADKFPLSLIDEFHHYICEFSKTMEMIPKDTHPILTSYDHIFDDIVRLNKQYFDKDPMAAGVGPRPGRSGASDVTTILDQEESSGSIVSYPTYRSPNLQSVSGESGSGSDGDGKGIDDDVALAGEFKIVILPSSFALRFYKEDSDSGHDDVPVVVDAAPAPVVVPTPIAVPAPTPAPARMPSPVSRQASKKEKDPVVVEIVEEPLPSRHAVYPYFVHDSSFSPLSEEDELELDDAAQFEYRHHLSEALAELLPAEIKLLDTSNKKEYNRLKKIVQSEKQRRSNLVDEEYVRRNPPVNKVTAEFWVSPLDISPRSIELLLISIRDQLIKSIELESCLKLKNANKLTVNRKELLTEDLEDQLRTHWPRRGRVETQVKQPREAEIMGHKEKTWRHIQNITQKMTDLQHRFLEETANVKRKCEDYVHEIDHLKSCLSGDFKNLAMLQVCVDFDSMSCLTVCHFIDEFYCRYLTNIP